jgi:hypothetical protein
MEGKEEEEKVKEGQIPEEFKESLAKYGVTNITQAVDKAALYNDEIKQIGATVDIFKKFFREVLAPGDQISGKAGFVHKIPKTDTKVDPQQLKDTLEEIGREDEFVNFVSVKIVPARTGLGTIIFNKVATISEGTPSIKIGLL